jgi:hypothetical protein
MKTSVEMHAMTVAPEKISTSEYEENRLTMDQEALAAEEDMNRVDEPGLVLEDAP